MSEPHDHLDLHEELHELTRAIRQVLSWQARAGAYAVSARSTRHPGDEGLYPDDTGPAAAEAPAMEARDAEDIALGGMSAALARALGEEESPRGAASRPSTTQPAQPAAQDPRAPHAPPAPHTRGEAAEERGAPPRRSLADVRADLGDCQRCKLAGKRTNIVFGHGDPRASLMFIGEAPGEQEDRQGIPFVGPAGGLLDDMIRAMGWTRDTVYIANVLKCRPPGNRDPQPDEIAACRPFLTRQIAAIAPRVIVTLGRPAAHLLLDTDAPMHALRGTFRSYQGIKLMPTFHPAYLLRNKQHKRETWNDLKAVIAELDRLGIRTPLQPRT